MKLGYLWTKASRELPSALPLYHVTTPPDYTLTAYGPNAGISAFDWTGPLGDPANQRVTPVNDYLAETGENMIMFQLKFTCHIFSLFCLMRN